MGMAVSFLILMSALVSSCLGSCVSDDWTGTLKNEGWSRCAQDWDYLAGFTRGDRPYGTASDPLTSIERAQCCGQEGVYAGAKTQTVIADWSNIFLSGYKSWAFCPEGYFMQGLRRADSTSEGINNFKHARCTKPATHPHYYGQCYTENVWNCLEVRGLCSCKPGFHLTGLFKSECDALYCLEELRCCAMAPIQVLKETSKIKSRMMDITLKELAKLGYFFGYAYPAGCKGQLPGDDYWKEGETWVADASSLCSGIRTNERLKIVYGQWSFGMTDIKYGDPIIQELKPETVDSGTFYNEDITSAEQTISREAVSIRTVTHTAESTFKNSHELNLQLTYNSPSISLGPINLGKLQFSAGYKFNYEKSTTTTDVTGSQQSSTFSLESSKTLEPNTAAKWKFVLAKQRVSIPYTATVVAKFSVEFQGWLHGLNLHSDYYLKHTNPVINYRFGDANVPFYEALKTQSVQNSLPWMWYQVKSNFLDAKQAIDYLIDQNNYLFTVTGRFDDVVGTNVEFKWDTIPLTKRDVSTSADDSGKRADDSGKRADDSAGKRADDVKQLTVVAQAGPNDTPPADLVPPKVDLPSG